MEKRSRQRVRDQVAHMAFGAEKDIHDGQEHNSSTHGPDTEAQDRSSPDRHFWLATRGRSIQMGQFRTHAPHINLICSHSIASASDRPASAPVSSIEIRAILLERSWLSGMSCSKVRENPVYLLDCCFSTASNCCACSISGSSCVGVKPSSVGASTA